jgi:hypothetical protein
MSSLARKSGLGVLGVVTLWVLSIVAVNLTLYTPGNSVLTYLEALETRDFGFAAAKAGLSYVPTTLPEASGSLTDPRILRTATSESGQKLVEAEYTLGGTTETTVFELETGKPTLWLYNTWRFAETPTANLQFQVTGDDRVDLNGFRLANTPSGVVPASRVFVPGVYEASLTTPWVSAPAVRATVSEVARDYPLRLRVAATKELMDDVTTAVENYLDDCAAQEVLQPVGCPFGMGVSDRVVGVPDWTVLGYPLVTLTLGSDNSSWDVTATDGVVEARVVVRSLFDGSLSEVSESFFFGLGGRVVGTLADAPVLSLY